MAVDTFLLIVRDASLEGVLYQGTNPWASNIKYFGPSDNINAFGSQWKGVDAVLIRPDARVSWIWRALFPLEQLVPSTGDEKRVPDRIYRIHAPRAPSFRKPLSYNSHTRHCLAAQRASTSSSPVLRWRTSRGALRLPHRSVEMKVWVQESTGSSVSSTPEFFGFGQVLLFVSSISYRNDAYTIFAGSALASTAILCSLFGAALQGSPQ
ncbi:hypothetical protein F5Y06DRAFT_302626 [Hypoxylon sp. FL0890]|nr:hypothetical protein F5Y06DRAFT_302626 [Hypoxylon sp. FL0890]